MQIVEYFLSVQGEGKFAGNLALFVRFAGCNLNCAGFKVTKKQNGKTLIGCDTLKAVFTQEFENSYKKMNSDTLIKELLKLAQNKKPLIIITGGEPSLHHKKAEFLSFITKLIALKFQVHFESNASIFIDFEKYPIYKQCSFAMSVKLSNSGEVAKKRLNFKAIKAICLHSKYAFYKFVLDATMIKNNKAKTEIQAILAQVKAEVFCMPMGSNAKELQTNALKTAEFCIKMGYNYSDRIHIRLWGAKEGV